MPSAEAQRDAKQKFQVNFSGLGYSRKKQQLRQLESGEPEERNIMVLESYKLCGLFRSR